MCGTQRVNVVTRELLAEHCRNGEEPGDAQPRIAFDMEEPEHAPQLLETLPSPKVMYSWIGDT